MYRKTAEYAARVGSRATWKTFRHASTVPELSKRMTWPTSPSPTPYEVLGLQRHPKIDASILKKRYRELAMLYHPDTSYSSSASAFMSEVERLRRFKLVNEAYALLVDASRRQAYDTYNTGWAYSRPSTVAMSHTTYHQNPSYYSAGTWEDINNLNNDENTSAPLSLLAVLAYAAGIFVCVELAAFLSRLGDTVSHRFQNEDENKEALELAYSNYSMKTDKWTRIRRFLWFRSWGLHTTKEELDREASANEKLVRELKERKS
ncbi:HBL146Cp [Eremothecium sinecaudum]|uniref:HBL146Cp n=1 Tax=Eremothecium sinecaudum TaxID=45286 RepID=A0A125RDW3_9SACH|nr:HBL146Cp [Eremothecium sinecaudum]AMD18756.1 HBL146Cp [Eremothecium sinecaudum]